MSKQLKLTIAFVLIQFSLLAQSNGRKYSNEFMHIGAGARGIGMSKSIIASVSDANSTYWNPSVMCDQDRDVQITAMYASYFGNISKYNFVAFTKKISKGTAAIGFSFLRLGTDNIPNTLQLIGPDGNIDYNRISYFNEASYAYTFSYSKKLERWSSPTRNSMIGGNLRMITRSAGSFAKAWGLGVDFAYTMRSPKFKFAVVLRDATTTYTNWTFNFSSADQAVLEATNNELTSSNTEVALPQADIGLGKVFAFSNKLNLLAELNLINNFDGIRNSVLNLGSISIDPNMGLELSYNNKVMLRGGLGNLQKQQSFSDSTKKITTFTPSLGIGMKFGSFNVDYAFSKFENSSNNLFSHFVSISVGLKKKSPPPTPEIPRELDSTPVDINTKK